MVGNKQEELPGQENMSQVAEPCDMILSQGASVNLVEIIKLLSFLLMVITLLIGAAYAR